MSNDGIVHMEQEYISYGSWRRKSYKSRYFL